MSYSQNKVELESKGYSIVDTLYTANEVLELQKCLEQANPDSSSFLKTKDLFAIRQLFITVPEIADLIFNTKLKLLLSQFFKDAYFLSKAIYFDKPKESNWFVPFHQDLSISVNKKTEWNDFKNWTFKKGQHGVQPPLHILQDTLTVRIHIDDTDKNNGALKVIPQSHLKGIIRKESKDWNIDNARTCVVKKGSAMLMKPLTLHASNRTTNSKKRRVIHLEFNSHNLPETLDWLERFNVA